MSSDPQRDRHPLAPPQFGRLVMLRTDLGDADLIGLMRYMERSGLVPYYVVVDGLNEDPRFLFEIGDCLELFRRCVRTALVSQLAPNIPNSPGYACGLLGAFEVWGAVRGHVRVKDGQLCALLNETTLRQFHEDMALLDRARAEMCGTAGAESN